MIAIYDIFYSIILFIMRGGYMDKMQHTLFIGNGLNLCLKGSISWGDLLGKTANQLGVIHDPNIEMPLEFERIINEFLKKCNLGDNRTDMSGTYYAIKAQISAAMQISGSLGNCIHKSIPFDIINNIITTNYDMVLEQAYYEKKGQIFTLPSSINKKTKYYLQPTMSDEIITFYHPHGIITHPSSICLGYEHYMGLVETIRSKSNAKTKKDSQGNFLPVREMKISRILRGDDPYTNESWEKFYTSDMAFIGFGLPSCESDIWWLLTHRAYIYYSNHDLIGDYIKNHIIYYDVINLEQNEYNYNEIIEGKYNCLEYKNPREHYNNKHKLLDGMHVEVRLRIIGPNKTYEDVYRSILDELSDLSSWKPSDGFDSIKV